MNALLDNPDTHDGAAAIAGTRIPSRTPDAGIPSQGGDALGAVLREYMDVTVRLQATHETLAREVTRLRGELEHKNRELERRERLAALGELAAGVAHEVRNPLGAIQLYSGLLRKQFGEIGPATALIEKIDAGIRAIDDVVQDTLALAPRGGALVSRGLKPIVENAIEFCRPSLETRTIRLLTTFADESVRVPVEEQALQRVLINLISNAVDASAAGGGVRVDVGAIDGGEIAIHVNDEGDGIPAEILERIFDPFFTTKAKGTGLGLSIAHRLVEAHGGRLSAANLSGGGAEFTVRLPAGLAGKDSRESGCETGISHQHLSHLCESAKSVEVQPDGILKE